MSDEVDYQKTIETPVAVPVAVPAEPTEAAEGRDVNGIRVGAWDAEFCGCFDHCVPNCCMVWCLPFVSIAQISHRMNIARFSYVLLAFLVLYLLQIVFTGIAFAAYMKSSESNVYYSNGYYYRSSFSDSTTGNASNALANAASSISGILYIVAIWQLRTKIRERFQIPGSCCEDYCAVMCCSCCTIAQMATHVKSYKPSSCDFGPPDILPAYEQEV